jgi:predicted nucleic acid-binding protein
MIVVDTNVLLSLYLPTSVSALADAVLQRDPAWIAPSLWLSEMRNAITTLVRARRVDIDHGLAAVEAAEMLMAERSYAVPSNDVLRLAEKSGCSAYDCEFVALAEALETRLVTVDKRLALKFPKIATPIERFAKSKR